MQVKNRIWSDTYFLFVKSPRDRYQPRAGPHEAAVGRAVGQRRAARRWDVPYRRPWRETSAGARGTTPPGGFQHRRAASRWAAMGATCSLTSPCCTRQPCAHRCRSFLLPATQPAVAGRVTARGRGGGGAAAPPAPAAALRRGHVRAARGVGDKGRLRGHASLAPRSAGTRGEEAGRGRDR